MSFASLVANKECNVGVMNKVYAKTGEELVNFAICMNWRQNMA